MVRSKRSASEACIFLVFLRRPESSPYGCVTFPATTSLSILLKDDCQVSHTVENHVCYKYYTAICCFSETAAAAASIRASISGRKCLMSP